MKKILPIIIILAILGVSWFAWRKNEKQTPPVISPPSYSIEEKRVPLPLCEDGQRISGCVCEGMIEGDYCWSPKG